MTSLIPCPCIEEVIILFSVHESFTQTRIEGFTLRRGVAFLHEMDITARWGSSLYPWETKNPFIGWAWKPDWRKWIIGNRSVPAVIMLQRCYRTLPQRWDGMSRGASFSLVSLTFFYTVNTLLLIFLSFLLIFFPFLFHANIYYQFQTFLSAVESFWLAFIHLCWLLKIGVSL